MVRIWCEWDIGADFYVFRDTEAAIKWLDKNLDINEILGEEIIQDNSWTCVADIIRDQCIGFEELTLID